MNTQLITSQNAGFMDFSRLDAAIECCKMNFPCIVLSKRL